MAGIRPFRPVWEERRGRLCAPGCAATAFPPPLPAAGWRHGCDPAFFERFCRSRTEEATLAGLLAALGRFPQLLCTIEGLELHAVHVGGGSGGGRPLLLHGWSGSFFDFDEVIGPLAFPSRHGGCSSPHSSTGAVRGLLSGNEASSLRPCRRSSCGWWPGMVLSRPRAGGGADRRGGGERGRGGPRSAQPGGKRPSRTSAA